MKTLKPCLETTISFLHFLNKPLADESFRDKPANITQNFKKDDPEKINNYRPLTVLSSVSAVFEIPIQNQIVSYVNRFLLSYLFVYRNRYST